MTFKRSWFALAAALLFGASTPAAKFLTGHVDPFFLAGLLYLGSGVGLGIWILLRKIRGIESAFAHRTAKKKEWLFLAGAVLAGGVVGPALLMFGLVHISSSSASLLLNLEGAFTAAIACLVFHERYGRRLVFGLALILFGGAVLAFDGSQALTAEFTGTLCIAGACLCWSIDNNLTRYVESLDASVIASVKGVVAGTVNCLLALAVGQSVPAWPAVFGSAVVGFFGYGLSLVLFIYSLRRIGTARTSAYFSTAPFVGATVSIAILREPLSWQLAIAGLLMAIGVWLHLTEQAEHRHEAVEHSHLHTHDKFHQHSHAPNDPPGEPHAHLHRHEPVVHAHEHGTESHTHFE